MKTFLLLFLIVLVKTSCAEAKYKPMIFHDKPTSREPIDIRDYTWFYEDRSGDPLPLSAIQQQSFRPFSEKRNERTSHSDKSIQFTWLRFAIRNPHLTDTLKLFFNPGVTLHTNAYEGNQFIGTYGIYSIPTVNHSFRHIIPITIPPGRENTYWIRILIYISPPSLIKAQLYTPEAAYRLLQTEAVYVPPLMLAMGMIAGCLLFMSLYAMYHYWLSRDKSFLYYALYVFSCFLIALANIDIRFGLAWLYPYLHPTGVPLTTPLTFAFYLLFMVQLLNLKKNHPRMHILLQGFLILLISQQLLSIIEFFHGKPLFADNTYYIYILVPSALSLLLLFGLIIMSKSSVKKYLLVGIISLVVVGLIPSFTNLYFPNLSYSLNLFLNYLPLWSLLGLTIECFCFALALAYRSRLVELEKNQLQQSYTQQLENELTKRTQEIEVKNQELEAQHLRQLEQGFEQKLAETEMTALRAQMNPHFIFNCLNSIKLFATQNNGSMAADYLTKFSRLIRLVLENSRCEKVTLQNELEALRLYLEMEAMRFNDKLRYEIKVDEQIDAEFVEIPPLLIQPYVENAIWHGLMHKPEGGKVTVRMEQPTDDSLLIHITDDGVGRARATALKSKSAIKHKSFGMKVTSERIHLINQLYQSQTQVQVHDLVDTQGEPAGTEVVITIPI